FLQAEDGIRDGHGTGVQTCALPILIKEREPVAEPGKPQADSDRAISRCNALSGALREDCLRQEHNAGAGATRPIEPATAPPPQRSEERRVGKEGSSRRSPEPQKYKA